MPKPHNIAPGKLCRPTSSSGVPWISGCSGDGIRDLQASPGGPGAVGGGSLYTSQLLLLVTSEPWGHKSPIPGPRESEKRARGTHFIPPAFPSDKHEVLTRTCSLESCLKHGDLNLAWGSGLSIPEIPVFSCPPLPSQSRDSHLRLHSPRGAPFTPLDQVATPVYTKNSSPASQLLGIPILEVTHISPGEPCPLLLPDR